MKMSSDAVWLKARVANAARPSDAERAFAMTERVHAPASRPDPPTSRAASGETDKN